MKILHLISSGGMYGAEAVILDLSRCLDRAGHISLLGVFGNPAQQNTALAARARAQELEMHTVECARQVDRAVPGRIRDLVAATGADVVHAHGYKADVYAYWALHGSATPLVSTCHNWIDSSLSLRLYGVLDRTVLKRFDGVVAVSDGVREQLLMAGVHEAKIRLIRNGVDLDAFASIQSRALGSPQALTVGVVARLSHEKGVDTFLRAAALVAKEVPNARFVVAGDGPDRAMLDGLVQKLQLGRNVQFLGRQENMAAFYASLDLQVLPSRMEGLPMALLEGMASGLPVVATAVGEVAQVMASGDTGLLVAPDNPAAMAQSIVTLLHAPERLRFMGINARQRVAQEFSGDRMAAEYLSLYDESRLRKLAPR